jgi:hypothetical protein
VSTSYPELILHVGAGKTGSTSIQFTLRDAGAPALAEQGLAYFGLMLETLEAARAHDWCVPGQPQLYFQARGEAAARADAEAEAVALEALRSAGEQGIRRVVWSNEAFLVQNKRILPLAERLAGQGVPVQVVAYVRRHDKRAQSAYVEFALKSKRFKGPLKPFRDWVGAHMQLGYAEALSTWTAAFPGRVGVYNFDALDDVAQHFCALIGASGLSASRANETPSDALMTAWTVYNGTKERATWAGDFRRVARPLKLLADRDIPPLDALLPSSDDLAAAQALYAEDAAAVNRLLAAQGQPELTFDPVEARMPEVSDWEMNRMLLQMVFSLQEQVLKLQKQVDDLDQSQDSGGGGG